ncbi:phosphatidylinositol-4-phosphate 5-Kinase domain-containing protein [Ditylenchus destructor]|uniref:Phosphatidylinositol-4-phosphate 5-Kinase domain-containing protein n=1 Tax=Ditylenchus destructor TaxID=166010 RepID=A0AAD4QV32_9BILA|nr:phosphatidylinositol-4-phosphate 5-Kinase domain-containing protein [Ditylenchus destructor]
MRMHSWVTVHMGHSEHQTRPAGWKGEAQTTQRYIWLLFMSSCISFNAAWLFDHKALDYSILVIISEWEKKTTRNSLHGTLRPDQTCTVDGVPKKFQIRIAIIDTLVLECFRKTIEDLAKSFVQIITFQDPNDVTIKPPDVYRDRIYNFAEKEMFPYSARRSTVG